MNDEGPKRTTSEPTLVRQRPLPRAEQDDVETLVPCPCCSGAGMVAASALDRLPRRTPTIPIGPEDP